MATSLRLIHPPAAVYGERGLWVAWSESDGQRLRIRVAQRKYPQDKNWCDHGFVSDSQVDAFRPVMAASQNAVFFAWDEYRHQTYRVVLAASTALDQPFEIKHGMGGCHERWMCPALAAKTLQEVYLVSLVLQTVTDDRGIVHQQVAGGCECDFEFTDGDALTGTHFYFLRVKLEGATSFNDDPKNNNPWPFTRDSRYPHNLAKAHGCFAWTSPIWVTF